MTVAFPQPTVLCGQQVRLEPASLDHVPRLLDAGSDDEVWRWLWVARPTDEAAMADVVAQSLAMPARITWTIFASSDAGIGAAGGAVAGSTSYYDIDVAHRRLEIGYTWLGRPWWRTGVNVECKLLLLRHAFDELGFERVALRTDHRNVRSQTALEALGAVREGVLRHHILRPDGTWRDSVYYSILRAEWPAVHDRLRQRLARRLGRPLEGPLDDGGERG